MSRAALLVMSSDPFLNAYWFDHYRRWADQVDVLRILVCDQSPELQEVTRDQVNDLPVADLTFWPRTDHGVILRYLFDRADEDTVLLVEDDAFVREPAFIGECFRRIESGSVDVIGTPRSTGTPGVIDYANETWGQWVASTGEAGPIMWPTFLFAKRNDLERTDRNFSVWGGPPGVTLFDHRFDDEQAMDTFGWMTLQLRNMGLRFGIEPNYRAQLNLLSSWTNAPWFHVGGLSVGHGLYFLGDPAHAGIADALRGQPQDDWEKRVSWWLRVGDGTTGPLWYKDRYNSAVAAFIASVNMDLGNVLAWRRGFDALVNW